MKIEISSPDHLLVFADEQVQTQVRRYIDEHGWDTADDEKLWQQYQQARMAEEYGDDNW